MDNEILYKILTKIYTKMISRKELFSIDFYYDSLEELGIEDIEDKNIKNKIIYFFENLSLDDLEFERSKLEQYGEIIKGEIPIPEEYIPENEYSDNSFINNIIKNSKKRW